MKTVLTRLETASSSDAPAAGFNGAVKDPRLWLSAVILAAFAVRAMFLVRPGSRWAFSDDSGYYLELARGFLHGCGFAPFSAYCGPPEVLRLPGYPLFLIPFAGHFRLTVAVQALLGALTCYLAAKMAGKKRGAIAALIAAGLVAFDLPTILVTKELVSEALFQCMAFAAIFACFEGLGILAAGLLGLCIFIRPVGLAIIPAGVLILCVKRNWKVGFAVLGVLSVLVLTWALRNDRQIGIFNFTIEGAANLFWFTAPGVIAHHDGVSPAAVEESLNHALDAHLGLIKSYKPSLIWGPAGTPAGSRLMLARAIETIRDYPLDTALVTLEGFAQLAFEPYQLETGWQGFITNKDIVALVKRACAIMQTALLVLLWSGVVLALIKRPEDRDGWLLLCAALVLLLAAAPFPGNINVRFRTPAIPFLSVLAGMGWASAVLPHHVRGRIDET